MSEGDFEVMPRGTMEEIRVLREFVHKLDEITKNEVDIHDFVIEVSREVGKIQTFYRNHVERYPNP